MMNKTQTAFYESFITSTIKIPILYFIMIIIQYISIFSETLNSIVKLNGQKTNYEENFSMNVNRISPIYLFQSFISSNSTTDIFPILILSGGILIFLFVIIYTCIIKNHESKIFNILKFIFVNYSYIYFTVVIEIFYLIMFNKILNVLLVSKFNESIDILYFFLSVIGVILLTYAYFIYVKNIYIMVRYKYEIDYHTDSMFGKTYNLFVLIMKILISLEINFQLIESNLTKKASQLLNIVKIFMLLVFLIYIYINLLKKNILYVLSIRYNMIKIFILYFNIFLIILQLVFYESFKDATFILFCIISIFFSITVITKIDNFNKENLLFNQEVNGIKLITYILGLKVGNKSKENKEISIDYNRFLIIHQSTCSIGKIDCSLCKHLELSDIFEFIESYYKYLKHQYKANPKDYINQKQELVLIKLVKYFLYYECPEKNFNYNKLIYSYFRILKSMNKDSYIYTELEKIMCLVKPILSNESSIGPIIKKYENCSDQINDSINEYEDFLSKSLYNSKNDITEFSQKLFNYKTKIENNMTYIISQKNFFINDYHINIIRYNYVMLFNTELKCLNFAVFNEDIEETFNKLSNNMFVLYNIKNDTFIICNSTSDFYKFRNCALQDIFPKEIKSEGILKFKEMMLNNEDSKFNFDFVIESDNSLIRGIKMKCTILESTDKEEIFIICDYKLKNSNEIIVLENYTGNKQIILMTKEISEILYLKPSHLKNISNSHIEMIFTTKGTVNQDDPNRNEIFTLRYKHYKEVHRKFMNEVKRAVEAEDVVDENIYETMGDKKLDFFIKNYQTIQTKDMIYNFYEVSHLSKDTNKGEYVNGNNEEEVGGDENQSVFQSSVNGGGSGALGITQSPNKKSDDITNTSHVKKYIYSAIIINLIIIIYGVVSILIMSNDGSNAKNLYSVASLFYNLNKVFCITTNSFFSRVKINRIKNTGEGEEIDYFRKFNTYENVNIDVNAYINEIVELLLQDFTIKLSDYTKAVLNAKAIFGNELDYLVDGFYINSAYDEKIKDYKVYFYNQSDSVNNQLILFINRIRTIFGSHHSFYNVTIFSFKKNDFSNLENKSLNDLEKYTYNSVMSYLNYLNKIFLKIQALIKLKTAEFLNSMNNRYILLYLGNIGVNLLFMLNCFVIISVFNIILKKQNEIFAKGINKDLSHRTSKRMKSLKILNNLYQTKPMPIIEDINKEINKSQNKVDVKTDEKDNILNLAEQDNRVMEFIPVEKMRKNILEKIITYFTILIVAFAAIFAYSSVNFDSLTQTLAYVEYNFNVEAYLISNVNTLQVMLVSNQTDIEIYEYLNDNKKSEVGQVRWKINNFFKISATYQANYYFKQSVIELQSRQANFLNCEKLVNEYDINMIKSISARNPKFQENNIKNSLISICSKLNYMNKYSDFNILFSEMIYRTQYILNKYEFAKGDYKKIKEVYDDPEFFGLKALIILFLRPISGYYSSIQDFIVINSFNGVLMFNVLSVVINIFLDILMLILIYRVIIIMLKTLTYYKSMEVSFRII